MSIWNICGTIPVLIITLPGLKFAVAATTFTFAKMFSGYLKEIPEYLRNVEKFEKEYAQPPKLDCSREVYLEWQKEIHL